MLVSSGAGWMVSPKAATAAASNFFFFPQQANVNAREKMINYITPRVNVVADHVSVIAAAPPHAN